MGAFNLDSFVFTALSDFRAIDNPDEQLAQAHEYGIRIIDDVDFGPDDWRIVKGPFWRFRRRASQILRGLL